MKGIILRQGKAHPKIVELRFMKDVAPEFPSPVKELIMSEPDVMDIDKFLADFETWEKLLRINGNKNR